MDRAEVTAAGVVDAQKSASQKVGNGGPAQQALAPHTSTDCLLLSILAELRGLRGDFKDSRSKPEQISLSRADLALLGRLLPAIGGVYGSRKFSSRDLVEDAAPAVRVVLRGLSVKAVSKLFARAAGIPIDGLMVIKQGFEFGVTTWQIVAEGFKPVLNPATGHDHQVQSAQENEPHA